MSGEKQRSNSRTAEAPAQVPTAEKIVELLKAAAPAPELDEKLKRVFRLSEAQSSVRVK